jgi:hypothetical protein
MCPEKDTKNSRLCQELGKFKGQFSLRGLLFLFNYPNKGDKHWLSYLTIRRTHKKQTARHNIESSFAYIIRLQP